MEKRRVRVHAIQGNNIIIFSASFTSVEMPLVNEPKDAIGN